MNQKLAIVMVGLPARGKSFTAVRLTSFLESLGYETKHFNLGKLRRLMYGHKHSADFFDGENAQGARVRSEIALVAVEEMLHWLHEDGGQIAVLDATNTTKQRRDMILQMARGKCEVVFLEVICNVQSIIDQNISKKVEESPDYVGRLELDHQAAFEDFKKRLENYERAYEPVDQGAYIKMIDTATSEGRIEVCGLSHSYLVERILRFLASITPSDNKHLESIPKRCGDLGCEQPELKFALSL